MKETTTNTENRICIEEFYRGKWVNSRETDDMSRLEEFKEKAAEVARIYETDTRVVIREVIHTVNEEVVHVHKFNPAPAHERADTN